jgi:hypothetical protein
MALQLIIRTGTSSALHTKYISHSADYILKDKNNGSVEWEVFWKYKNLMFVTHLMMARGAETCCEERE